MGWTAITGELSLYHTLPLYASGVCWTLVYDTLYGYQDRKDDRKLGLKSTSLYLGENPQMPLTVLCGGMMTGLVMTGYTNGLALPYFVLVLKLNHFVLYLSVKQLRYLSTSSVYNTFRSFL